MLTLSFKYYDTQKFDVHI